MIANPSVRRLVAVVRALGPLADRVVFIGGAVAPLFHTAPAMSLARQTKDVDGVVASLNYSEFNTLCADLREIGFTNASTGGTHMHRWRSPAGDLLDLVPAGHHLGATGSTLDTEAIVSAVSAIVDDTSFRHVSVPVFLAMKLSAFSDRGGGDWLASHDVEDVVAVLASRPSVANDVAQGSRDLRQRLSAFARELLLNDALDDLLSAHLNNATDPREAKTLARQRLVEIATLD